MAKPAFLIANTVATPPGTQKRPDMIPHGVYEKGSQSKTIQLVNRHTTVLCGHPRERSCDDEKFTSLRNAEIMTPQTLFSSITASSRVVVMDLGLGTWDAILNPFQGEYLKKYVQLAT
ncbi:hypothetical protein IV203_031393 [Nitzschia inconspicua]|uniref:Uncharacterized protein n=1 Tax=Nitzschia inconspicua TaxID=303405 RepID=A0A9K3Q335_9STRA|nr:hypothetical protein IV203_031393 [Nitzschia inconspicua]